jgi:hypothetical protein
MNKLALLVLIVALLLTSSLATANGERFGSEYPYTDPPTDPGQGGKWQFPTMVAQGFPCGFGPFGSITEDSHAVMARNGMQTLVCVGEAYQDQVPDKGVHVEEGFTCGLHFLGIWSEVSKMTITPTGKVIMTCHTMQSMHAE